MGKGRQIAALICDFWENGGRRVIWVSVSNDLRLDAKRDLLDVKANHIDIFPKVCSYSFGPQVSNNLILVQPQTLQKRRGQSSPCPIKVPFGSGLALVPRLLLSASRHYRSSFYACYCCCVPTVCRCSANDC